MSAMPSPAQSEFDTGLLPIGPSVEVPAVCPTDLKNDRFPNERPSLGKQASRSLASFLVMFCLGAAAALAWRSYGAVAGEMIGNAFLQLGRLAPQTEPVTQSALNVALTAEATRSPDPQQLHAISLDLDAVRQSIDRIAAGQEQMLDSFGQLAAGQEQMTREIIRLQAVEQYVLYKRSEPPSRPAPAPIPIPRPSQAPAVR